MKSFLFALLFLSATAQAVEPENADSDLVELSRYYFAAARVGDTQVLREFSQAGFPLELRNAKGYSALMIATYNGNAEAVDYLLQKGADACAQDRRGNTALMAAIFRAEMAIASTLLKQNCDPLQANKAGHSAEDFASVFGRDQLVQLLQQQRKNGS
ncbi:ankyrin repeat domain-containing protein [Microbulbifer sp. OS29]|uniref:Ankyrin repeat domain-containing protein n=1 Tax=Microbulbifer okhotskensis TaxID=2926617 RepID=A0A9X2EM28_9GAMM|nr:ankyrin repeat domain-containing protein [Microbulbifer okhotskensis]MCO1334134.1 ankyrin repeat domain-containing protein [Microbulbifer okhotskensis]